MEHHRLPCPDLNDGDEYDVVVVGAGASGMTAALVALQEGLKVLLIEASAQVGGTSARSAGTLWVPGNRFEKAAADRSGQTPLESARTYLDASIGDRSPARLRERFLNAGPELVEYLLRHSHTRFKACPRHSDYYPWLEGSREGYRAIEPQVFDGRQLGPALSLLRPPLQEFMVFGGMMVSKADIDLLLKAGKNWPATWHAVKLASRYLKDRLRYRRGTRLTMGNALTGSLLCSLLTRKASILFNSTVLQASALGAGEHRLLVRTPQGERTLVCRKGLILAGGGFSANRQWRERYLPSPTPTHTATSGLSNATTLELGLALGGVMGAPQGDNAWWFPSSIASRADGSTIVYPHILMDRGKPGVWAIDGSGRRFVNEGLCYHEFSRAQYALGAIPCWLICDARALKRYGMGLIRPGAHGARKWVREGYLKTAADIPALAAAIGVPAAQLVKSVSSMNDIARSGRDEQFGRGEDHLSRQNGDAAHGPSPSLGPISSPPFYAVQLQPADLGTAIGLQADEHARLLDARGNAVAGVYVCGNDMNSIMGGQYPAPGVTLGPGMTFAYLAARHCATARAAADQPVSSTPNLDRNAQQ